MQIHKIQGIKVKQSPFQRRKGLASIILFTAAGNLDIPYISIEQAHHLRDIVLYRVETDRRAWM